MGAPSRRGLHVEHEGLASALCARLAGKPEELLVVIRFGATVPVTGAVAAKRFQVGVYGQALARLVCD